MGQNEQISSAGGPPLRVGVVYYTPLKNFPSF